jgi:hypothetical protein
MTTNTTARAGEGGLIDPNGRAAPPSSSTRTRTRAASATSTAPGAGTDPVIDPLGGGRAMGLPLLGIMADVMSQIPGMNLPPEQPADRHPDAARPQAHVAVTASASRPSQAHAPRPDGIRPRSTSRSRAGTMKTNTGTTAGADVRIDPNG